MSLPGCMLRILLIEDNPADAHMLRAALEKTGMPVEITHAKDGVEALEYLATDARSRQCDVVLLDLNLPRLTGFEVLEHIRSREELKKLPVVIMSGSANIEEIDRCYYAGANSYICKPIHFHEILATAAGFVSYWSTCVKLPSKRWVRRTAASYMTAAQAK
jgi:two-component system, chemotaxis family, response regulator Rcp1